MSRKNVAGSSITNLIGVAPRAFLNGGDVPLWQFRELGAEVFKAGEMVCLSGSTTTYVGVTRAGTDASGYGILGFAGDNASGFCSSTVGVFLATNDTVFVGNIGDSSTSANAQTAASDMFMLYGLTSLSGRTYVDKAKGLTSISTAMCRVLGFHGQDDVPSFYGRVFFQVLSEKCQLNRSMWTNISANPALAI